MHSNYLWLLFYEHMSLNKSDNKDSFACKALIGQNLENCGRDFAVEHKCSNLNLCAKFLIKSKKKSKRNGQLTGFKWHISSMQYSSKIYYLRITLYIFDDNSKYDDVIRSLPLIKTLLMQKCEVLRLYNTHAKFEDSTVYHWFKSFWW